MFRQPAHAALVLACLAALGGAAAQPGPPPSRFIGGATQTVRIMDNNGFDKPMTAATMQIPQGWQSQGQVRWQPQATCLADGTQFEFRAQDADGVAAIELIPGTGWSYATGMAGADGPCLFSRIETPRDYLALLVGQFRPGAAIVDYQDRPDIAGMSGTSNAGPGGMETETRNLGGQVLIDYSEGGSRFQEIIITVISLHITRMTNMLNGGVDEIANGVAGSAFAMRAPEGRLDPAFADDLRASFALDPEWQARMQAHHRAMAADTAQGIRQRSETARRTSEEVGDIMMDGWRRRNARDDIQHDRTIRAIRGVDRYGFPLY